MVRNMIIKRTTKLEMPNLKRCKLEDPDCEDREAEGEEEEEECVYKVNSKKRKSNGYHSVANGDLSNGSGDSWSSGGSYWGGGGGGELESNSKRLNGKRAERYRPPL